MNWLSNVPFALSMCKQYEKYLSVSGRDISNLRASKIPQGPLFYGCKSPVIFRIATSMDADAIIVLDHIAKTDKKRVEFIYNQIESSSCYIALKEEKLVAYAVLNYKFYDNGWIELLYVHPKYRRQGIGSALVSYLFKVCSTEKLFTSTNQSNLPMQQLVATLGFSRSGIIENLDEGDPELIYLKLLSVITQ